MFRPLAFEIGQAVQDLLCSVLVCPAPILDVPYLFQDSCKLIFRRIFSTLYNLLEGDLQMLEDNVERCLGSEGVKSFDSVGMSDAPLHIKRLLRSCNGECLYGDESESGTFRCTTVTGPLRSRSKTFP